jgi:hypothetical protein
MIFDSQHGAFAVFGVAFIITVGDPRLDLSQIARPDRLAAQRTERSWAGRPAIHQDESHVAPLDAKQNIRMLSDGLKSTYPSAVVVLAGLEAIRTFP